MTVEALQEIGRRLAAGAVHIEHVAVSESEDGLAAIVRLDRQIIRFRASEQQLADDSVEAAIRNPRVQAVVAQAVERLNAELPESRRISTLKLV